MNVSKYCANPQKGNIHTDTTQHTGLDNKPNKHRKFNRGLLWTFVAVVAAILIASAILVLPLINKKAGHAATIRIPIGATEQSVQDSIEKYLGHDFAQSTLKAMRIIIGNNEQFRHGAWLIQEEMTPFAAARQILRGGQTGIDITLNAQRTKEDLARLFASKLDFTEQEFLDCLNSDSTLAEYDMDADHALCLFIEDKYQFFWDTTPQQVIDKMYSYYDQFWTKERIDRAEDLDMQPRGIYILASIVDSETTQSNEKGAIGRLYLNRIDQSMPLQADPTVIYAWRTDPSTKDKINAGEITRVTSEMTKLDNPYNTYLHKDLPPGPIRITSKATIDAILSSKPHPYMYMCADETLNGTHNFSVTYEEHLQNARRYQQALDAQGNTVNTQNRIITPTN